MSRRRALMLSILLASTVALDIAAAQDATRPITPGPGSSSARSSGAPQAQPTIGGRLDVPPPGGASALGTGGGQANAALRAQPDDQDRLKRLDDNLLAGGQQNLAGGDYGVAQPEPLPLAGGDYGQPAERQTPAATIAPTLLSDPLAAAPRGFRDRRLPPLVGGVDAGAAALAAEADDAYAPLGVKAGSFLLRPSLETAVGYDDNPDRVAGSAARGSSYGRLRGEIEGVSDWSRHELAVRSSGQIRKDVDIPASGLEPQFNTTVNGRVDVTERTQINTELRGSIAAARPGDPDTPNGIDGDEITRQAGATLGVGQRFNRLSFRADALIDRFTVDDSTLKQPDPLTGSTKVDNSDRAYNQYTARLRGSYEISPALAPFAEVSVDTRDYDKRFSTDAVDQNNNAVVQDRQRLGSDGYALRGGARFELSRLVTGEIGLGYGRQTPKDADEKPVDGLLIDGAVAWAPTALTTVRLNAATALQESTLLNASGVFSRTFEASVEHRLRRNATVTARAGFDRGEYKGTELVEDQVTLGLDGEYRLNRELALTGSLRKLWLNSSIPGEDYTASIIEFGLRFRR